MDRCAKSGRRRPCVPRRRFFRDRAAAPPDTADRHAAALVDAINDAKTDVHTFACCSGHLTKPGVPYIAFRGTDWEFVKTLLARITTVNNATSGQTRLVLSEFTEGRFDGSIRFVIYPWLDLADDEWTRMLEGSGPPPRRLVRLWWEELDELARLLRESHSAPSATFQSRFHRARARFGERHSDSEEYSS